jgi:hypothetical protein
MIKFLGLLKNGGWIAIPFIISTIAIMNWTVVNPTAKKLDKANARITELVAAVEFSESTVAKLVNIKGELEFKSKTDSVNHLQMVKEFQSTIAQVKSREKINQQYIKKLETGIRIDLIEKTFKDPIFGKPKLTDSTYTQAHRWGKILE